MSALHACPCGRTDIAHRDRITGSPLCVACFKLLGDFMRWLGSDNDNEYVALSYELRDLTFNENREWWDSAYGTRR